MPNTASTHRWTLPAAILLMTVLSSTLPIAHGSAQPSEVPTTEHSNLQRGRSIFRFDTFGSEQFFTGQLKLNEAVEQVSPNTALAVGLKVDSEALPAEVLEALLNGEIDLDDPAVTVELLRLEAVVGLRANIVDGGIDSLGITCGFCHSVVDDSALPGVGRRLDGWANRDLNVGAILGLSPNLEALAKLLGVDVPTVQLVLASWGPGKFDAHLNLDGQGLRPDGGSASVLIPPAFGLSGVNLATYTGWGSVPYWNALVANLEMGGSGRFFDPRLADPVQFPIAAANGFDDVSQKPDLISRKLNDLHRYQMALDAPSPPAASFDTEAAHRGRRVFAESGCVECHVPPLYTEPGYNLHTPEEMGIDSFQADRSPTGKYRTTPLKGLWSHVTGGFYHDGRFATLGNVLDHYEELLDLDLSADDRHDLEQFLLSL